MKRFLIRGVLLLLAAAAPARADVITLTNGSRVEGVIVTETPDTLTVKGPFGTLSIARSEIASVTRKPYAPPPALPEPPRPAPPAPARPPPAPETPAVDPAELKAKVNTAMAAFRTFEHSQDAEDAAQALVALGKSVVPAILSSLEGADPVQQKWLADVLGLLKEPSASDALLDLLRNPRGEVRRAAANALGLLKDAKAVQALIGLLKDDDWSVRLQATRSLSSLKTLEAVPALIPLLSDVERQVRAGAYDALTNITGENFPPEPAPWQAWWDAQPKPGK